MKIATGLFTGAALLLGQMAMAQVSPATAASTLSGKYAVFQVFNCEAQISITKDAQGKVTGVNLTGSGAPGAMAASVGYITLTPSSPTSGTATFTPSTSVGGGALRINGQGDQWSKSTKPQPDLQYSFTSTTFTFVNTQVFAMTYGNLVAGIYKTINLVGTDKSGSNAHCFSAMNLTRQN